MTNDSPTVVDLFAGCGGLSLGLEQAGFTPVFVNELHADAMETYLRNRDGFTAIDLRDRGRHAYDVLAISQDSSAMSQLRRELKRSHGEITLVAGGPPCQGFSGIGHRRSFDIDKDDIPSNHLYREMARVVEELQPRMFLFENVEGLLSSRWYRGQGEKGEIWRAVQAAFRRIGDKRGRRGYEVHWALVHAKDYGVPQNRPRVLMVGVREDLAAARGLSGTAAGFLPDPIGVAPDLVDLLGDLVDPHWTPGGETLGYPLDARSPIQRLMRQGVHGRGRGRLRSGDSVTEMQYSKHSAHVLEKFQYMLANGGAIHPDHQTKKFAQRLLPARWPEGGPSITATSLPDDYVHYSQPRTPTVREWARLQMFPDWYEFAGKRTTGGRRRAGDPESGDWSREVPKYTQIGNAVPVELARVVGNHLLRLAG